MALAGCAQAPAATTTSGNAPAAPAAETGPIVIAWLPNESGADLKDARDAFGELVSATLGRPVEHRTTTDYIIAVEAVANNNAHLAWFG
ncbi:MAG: phosphonate ABC transporter substrate-binding protein, partial [Chloroflexia bacterium]|nr:phosphonate ABC transporter substrate-binding protein [Chloroflexia bacterium]